MIFHFFSGIGKKWYRKKSLGTGIGKIWYRIKVPEPVSVKFSTGKSLGTGIGKIWYRKKYRYRYQKSIGIGIVQHFGYRHTLLPALPPCFPLLKHKQAN